MGELSCTLISSSFEQLNGVHFLNSNTCTKQVIFICSSISLLWQLQNWFFLSGSASQIAVLHKSKFCFQGEHENIHKYKCFFILNFLLFKCPEYTRIWDLFLTLLIFICWKNTFGYISVKLFLQIPEAEIKLTFTRLYCLRNPDVTVLKS